MTMEPLSLITYPLVAFTRVLSGQKSNVTNFQPSVVSQSLTQIATQSPGCRQMSENTPLESGIWNMGGDTSALALALPPVSLWACCRPLLARSRPGISVATAGGGSNNKGQASPRATTTTATRGAMGKKQPQKFMKHKSGGKKQT